jgi:hypothetical protein
MRRHAGAKGASRPFSKAFPAGTAAGIVEYAG